MSSAAGRSISAGSLDFSALVRAGDIIVCGQAGAEPLTLTRRLMAQSAALPPVTVVVGALYSDTFPVTSSSSLTFASYGAIGRAAALSAAGRLSVMPVGYHAYCALYEERRLKADIVLVQVSSRAPGRPLSLSMSNDYVITAARHARLVIAEVNSEAPWVLDSEWPSDIPIHLCVEASAPPLDVPQSMPDDLARQIAHHAASLIPDRAVLQFGVGRIPEAILGSLSHLKDLGIHSGLINDAALALIEAGVVTNAAKSVDRGTSVVNQVIGTRRLRDHAHLNPDLALRLTRYTHGIDVLAQIDSLIAINSAIDVALDGSVNAEMIGHRYAGAIGGQLDFVRGANQSRGGRAIIALPALAPDGGSRIVPRVNAVTTPRSDADAIVTEFGIAELRGCDFSERARRLIAIAAPEHREVLERAAFSALRIGVN